MTKKLLRDAFLFAVPFAIMTTGFLLSHTGTDLIIIGCTLFLANQLDKLID